jgi:outer membrane lipoprotein-sorting protein
MKSKLFYWVMVVSLILPAFSMAEEMTAEKVIQNCVDSYEKQMKGVKDITTVTDKWTTYQKWMTIEGKTVCKTRNEMEVMGKKFVTIYDGVYQWQQDPVSGEVTKEAIGYNPSEMMENLKTADTQYGGTEKIDGYKTYILSIKDMTKLMGFTKQEKKEIKEEKTKASGKIWVDAKDWVIRKMEVAGEGVDEKGKKGTVKITTEMKDFRKVNGLLIPYRMVTTMGGEGIPKPKLSPKEEQEMREQLAEMQERLKEMSPEERKMVEKMMKPQMEQMEKMLGGGGEVTEVKKVTINTGLSDDLFDGSKLK